MPCRLMLAVALLVLFPAVACGGDEEEMSGISTPGPTAISTPALTSEGTPDGVSPTGTAPRPTERTQSDEPTGAALSFSQLWQRRSDLVGERVSVSGRVLFTFSCPPGSPSQAGCVATGYLVGSGTRDLPPEYTPAVRLYEGGAVVECPADTLASLNCNGWLHDREYLVSGVLDYEVLGGRPSNTVILEVLSKELR